MKKPVSETIVSENGLFKVEKPPAEISEKGHPKNQLFVFLRNDKRNDKRNDNFLLTAFVIPQETNFFVPKTDG